MDGIQSASPMKFSPSIKFIIKSHQIQETYQNHIKPDQNQIKAVKQKHRHNHPRVKGLRRPPGAVIT